MTAIFLPADFAIQSPRCNSLSVTQRLAQGSGFAILAEADAYPRAGVVRIVGLRPDRHYLVQGAAQRFCRADARGAAQLQLDLSGPTLLVLSPVV